MFNRREIKRLWEPVYNILLVLIQENSCCFAVCWNVKPGPLVPRYGSTTGERIYLCIFGLSGYRSLQQVLCGSSTISPQKYNTIFPKSTSVTQQLAKRSQCLLQIRVLPSANFKLKRDSSLKSTLVLIC